MSVLAVLALIGYLVVFSAIALGLYFGFRTINLI